MTAPALVALPGNEAFAEALGVRLGGGIVETEVRRFPDGETYVRVDGKVEGRDVALVSTLADPDAKLVGSYLLTRTLRDLGARRVGLIAPYLPYMRQDARFRPGEALSSTYIGELVSSWFDWLVTVDPHLHRHPALGDVFTIPAENVHAASLLAQWIREHVPEPLLIGPDAESHQWVKSVAGEVDAPYLVLEKIRRGDRSVSVSAPDLDAYGGHTPVLVDDIISTGHTLIETIAHLRAAGMDGAVCVAIHAVFAEDALDALRRAGARDVVTTNTIAHETNRIDVSDAVADGVRAMMASAGRGV